MNAVESDELTPVQTPAPLLMHPPALPPPSPMAMPHQDLEVSATVRMLWRGVAVFGQTAQGLLGKCRRKLETSR